MRVDKSIISESSLVFEAAAGVLDSDSDWTRFRL
jgi:hypothetical protein